MMDRNATGGAADWADHHPAARSPRLELFYQPIFDLGTRRVEGLEALVRSPEPGLEESPAGLVRRAESAGDIGELGAWALGEAMRQLASWRADDPLARSVSMSVNASPMQFQDPRLADEVRSVLRRCRVPGQALWLEITEGLMMADTSATISTIGRLRRAGVRLAVDDFGTGYSSLAYLERFPVSRLKIDKLFVDGLRARRHDLALIRSIVWLGHTLGLSIVAEGIEHEWQATQLRLLGCRTGQGHLLSPAVPPAEVPALLAHYNHQPPTAGTG